MHSLLPALIVVALASIFQGTFGLCMKYIRPLAWEAWWLVYSTVAMVLLPIACAFIFVPHLAGSLQSSPNSVISSAMLFGVLWGVGGILFGKSVSRIGVALTYGIVMGLAASVGSLIPLLGQQGISSRAIHWVIGGNLLIIVGVAVSAWAGIRRERLAEGSVSTGVAMKAGLAMAILSGLLSAFLNIGFSSALPIAAEAVKRGAIARNASLAAWLVVLMGAFATNAGYSLLLLMRNHTWSSFFTTNSWDGWKWAIASGVLWFAALAVYGQGASLMGVLGPVVGWPMLLGLALILSNMLAVRAGEWKGASEALRWMILALFVLLIACCCLGYSNHVLNQ